MNVYRKIIDCYDNLNSLDINEYVVEIISHPDYNPNLWVVQCREMEMKKGIAYAANLLMIIVKYIDCKYYEVFPIEWWALIYKRWPSKLKQLIDKTQNEYLQQIMLLIELRG